MKKSKKKSKTERILALQKLFTEQLWQHLLVVAFVLLCAWIFDKYFEAIMFCVAHYFIRKTFDKQYHCGTTSLCLSMTFTIAFFGIASILPIAISLLSTVPMCYFISWIGYIAQDRVDLLLYQKTFELYQMTENELRKYGASKGLTDIQQDILVHRIIDNFKISEICEYRKYGRTTIKYHISEIKRKLGLKKL